MKVLKGTAVMVILLVLASGCAHPAFKAPTTITTKTVAVEGAERLGPVEVTNCGYIFLIIPIVSDPAKNYAKLLEEAQAAGGNTVLDVEYHSGDSTFWFAPLFYKFCDRMTGIAARLP